MCGTPIPAELFGQMFWGTFWETINDLMATKTTHYGKTNKQTNISFPKSCDHLHRAGFPLVVCSRSAFACLDMPSAVVDAHLCPVSGVDAGQNAGNDAWIIVSSTPTRFKVGLIWCISLHLKLNLERVAPELKLVLGHVWLWSEGHTALLPTASGTHLSFHGFFSLAENYWVRE